VYLCDFLSLTVYCADESVVFSLFMVLIFSYSGNVQLLRFSTIVMEGEVMRMLFWETKTLVRTVVNFLVMQLADTYSSSLNECMSRSDGRRAYLTHRQLFRPSIA
jgi:hypothetical protein